MIGDRYVLVWSGPGNLRGAFCPAAGLTQAEAEAAKERLYQHAREHNVRPVRDSKSAERDDREAIGVSIVPYYFDVKEARMK